jgi:hypothetical protein
MNMPPTARTLSPAVVLTKKLPAGLPAACQHRLGLRHRLAMSAPQLRAISAASVALTINPLESQTNLLARGKSVHTGLSAVMAWAAHQLTRAKNLGFSPSGSTK